MRGSTVIWCLAGLILAGCSTPPAEEPADRAVAEPLPADLATVLEQSRRITNSTGWFEILELPNRVYAFWEPGHFDRVNSFLILGSERDVLYDTGLGFASIGEALRDLRLAENLPQHELMVINSHNHLDHNGGNRDFDRAWIIEDEWAIRKLTEGLPAGEAGGFVGYWSQLADYPGVTPPEGFDPETYSIPPFPRENISFLADGDVVDLGDRRFKVIHTLAHSPDGLALYDEENQILFGGDTFIGDDFLIRDLSLLEVDLERASRLEVEYHYSSHGPQLIEVMRSGHHLSIIRRMIAGERTEGETTFAGQTFLLYELDGVSVTLAEEFLTY